MSTQIAQLHPLVLNVQAKVDHALKYRMINGKVVYYMTCTLDKDEYEIAENYLREYCPSLKIKKWKTVRDVIMII